MRANETYSQAKYQFSGRKKVVLMNVQCPHKWWSTLNSAVLGSSSSLPPLVSESGGLVCESVGKADLLLLSDHFDSKQSREAVNLPLASVSRSYHLCLQVERGYTSLVRFGPLWWH